MNSSPTSPDAPGDAARRDHLVADGGLRTLTTPRREAFETLDDLMVVVEALCPTWPPRPPFTPMKKMLL
ncbi:MAG: hypothetical protein L6Q83_13680 [Gammaproteobacteria bacterium]|nr:hypothetical protein [Gammaproteobacteria bacterium]